MATQTETKVIGDVVKYESDPQYTRDEKTVAASQTLVVGEVVNINSSSQVVTAKGSADEVQTMGITGTLTAGTFTLAFIDKTGARVITDPIAFNANTAAIQTGVDSALGASMVTVGGTAITATTFTFDGAGYAGQPQTLIEVDVSGLTGEADTTVTRTTESAEQKIDGVCLENFTTAAGETPKKPMLMRGPAIVDENQLTYGTTPLQDVRDALAKLNIVTRSES